MELLQFFTYKHLPPHLKEVSKPFCEMAKLIVDTLPDNLERDAAIRKLLEAKDCAVRAKLMKTSAYVKVGSNTHHKFID